MSRFAGNLALAHLCDFSSLSPVLDNDMPSGLANNNRDNSDDDDHDIINDEDYDDYDDDDGNNEGRILV